jgi:hypothetical protein
MLICILKKIEFMGVIAVSAHYQYNGSGTGSMRAKKAHKNRKNFTNIMF